MTTFDFDREYLRNVWAHQKSEKYLINYNHSQVGQKKPGIIEVHIDPPKWTFFGTIFRPLKGAAPSIFLHALEIDQGYLAHTPAGTGVPQKN